MKDGEVVITHNGVDDKNFANVSVDSLQVQSVFESYKKENFCKYLEQTLK